MIENLSKHPPASDETRDGGTPRYDDKVWSVISRRAAPAPIDFQSDSVEPSALGRQEEWELGPSDSADINVASALTWKKPPLRRWRIRFPCANASAISCEGACQLLCTLLARITALKDSNASVAKRTAGPKRRI